MVLVRPTVWLDDSAVASPLFEDRTFVVFGSILDRDLVSASGEWRLGGSTLLLPSLESDMNESGSEKGGGSLL